jgi:alpha-glucosidase (family GH31 glycosyl hydrolase)
LATGTYFNDHPFPANNGSAFQTTPDEVSFRWEGLASWMERGLTYWWFDANWAFSIPPPNEPYPGSGDGPSWLGMTNRVWGSHVYYTTMAVYNTLFPNRSHTAPAERPMSLTKYADDNMVPGLVQHQMAAHHRYPVWWTGDGVTLQASVESMVDAGVYDFKPYVHSDCGGDYRANGGDLLRWTEHCTFGTVFRYHGGEHQPWSYDQHTEDVIRSYLNLRYKMLPSLIAAGQTATLTGFPIVVRCDLFWPGEAAASDNHQYLHLNDTLVAPIWDSSNNMTSRSVWIPPGSWIDAWSGAAVSGPQTVTSTQPYERIPLWHRTGGFLVLASTPALRVEQQDWSELTLEAWPDVTAASVTERAVHERGAGAEPTPRTALRLATDGRGGVSVTVGASPVARAWTLRIHLRPGQEAAHVSLDGKALPLESPAAHHLPALSVASAEGFFPFGGRGSRPPPHAGPVLEVALPASAAARTLHIDVTF